MPATYIRGQIQRATRAMRTGLRSLLRSAHGGMDPAGAKTRRSRARRIRKCCQHAFHPQSRDHAGARRAKHGRAPANYGLWSMERLPKASALLHDPSRGRGHHPPSEARRTLGTRLGPYPICRLVSDDVLSRQRQSEGVDNPVPRSVFDISIRN